MKKVIILVGLIFAMSFSLMAQINHPYIGVFQRFEGISYFPKSGFMKQNTQAISITGLDVTIGRKVFFHGQFGFYAQMTPTPSLLNIDKGWNWNKGFSISTGAGVYVLDKRVDGIGHALSTSLNYAMKLALGNSSDKMENMTSIANIATPDYNIGGEILINYSYSLRKNLTLKAGINLGGGIAGSTSATLNTLEAVYGATMNYGFMVGVAF